MKALSSPTDWLERHWAVPAYAGSLLLALSLCFFGAATNTMAGWLYVLSGIIFALLGLGSILPGRAIKGLTLERSPIAPVSAGDDLTIELTLHNPTHQPTTLVQVWDILPPALGKPQGTAIEVIAPQSSHRWSYYQPTTRRGVYHWRSLDLRSGTPLGLFWSRRAQLLPTTALVYPQILPLLQCPLIDDIGRDNSPQVQSDCRYRAASEGVTKTLRPYRYGDSTRLIHWRSSARLDQFQVRELEIITGGQEVVICLDSDHNWLDETFEQAVIAAASLYFYAHHCQLNVKLWTAPTGLVSGHRSVLETLAAVNAKDTTKGDRPQQVPLLWLTNGLEPVEPLPAGSRWLIFTDDEPITMASHSSTPGMIITTEMSLISQLQRPLTASNLLKQPTV